MIPGSLEYMLQQAVANASGKGLFALAAWFSEAQALLQLAIDLEWGKRPPTIIETLRNNAERHKHGGLGIEGGLGIFELCADRLEELLGQDSVPIRRHVGRLREELLELINKAGEKRLFGLASLLSDTSALLEFAADLKEGKPTAVVTALRYRAQCLGTKSDLCRVDGVCHGEILARRSDQRFSFWRYGEKTPLCSLGLCHGEIFDRCANHLEMLRVIKSEDDKSDVPAPGMPAAVISESAPSSPSHDPILYVDGDETLFHRQDVLYRNDQSSNPNAVRLEHAGNIYFVAARPSARPFLEALQRYGKPDMATSGSAEFQTLVLETLGLRSLIGTVHGNVNSGVESETLNPPGKAVLIDDIHQENDGARAKYRKLGKDNGVQVTHIRCFKYLGGQDDPEPLTDLLPRIAQICS